MICLPATIDNNMPNSELSVGADSALNLIVDSIDRVRQAGTASRRCFVVETMGGYCGYLALLGGLSGGAVRVYLHEEGITPQGPVPRRRADGRQLPGRPAAVPDRDEREGQPDVHHRLPVPAVRTGERRTCSTHARSCSGQTQQGGSPSPFDRILGTRLAAHSIDWLSNQIDTKKIR